MARSSDARLIILPETALPLFLRDVPAEYLEALAAHARRNNGDVLLGAPERLPQGDYYNTVVSLGSANSQAYRKEHLVPFGEFIPLRPLLGAIVSQLAIPLQDFSRGGAGQQPLSVAGEQVAINICYEDAFGEEIIRQLPQATLLVNVSNVAWFGRSIAPPQHLQIAHWKPVVTCCAQPIPASPRSSRLMVMSKLRHRNSPKQCSPTKSAACAARHPLCAGATYSHWRFAF
jgi:apolipoprotein N-acyltransferase